MSSYIKKTLQNYVLLFAGVVAFFVLSPLFVFADSANISNNVTVSASGNGNSEASVKTIINGEIVEDTRIKGPGTIESSTTLDDSTADIIASTTITTDNTERDHEIRELIAKLMALIEHYVSLLNTIS